MKNNNDIWLDGLGAIIVIMCTIIFIILLGAGFTWLFLSGMKFIWPAYPLNFWQTWVALVLINWIVRPPKFDFTKNKKVN